MEWMNAILLRTRVIEKQLLLLQQSHSHFTFVSILVPLRHRKTTIICRRINLHHQLPFPVSIELHGVPVLFGYAATMDVPELTVPIDFTV